MLAIPAGATALDAWRALPAATRAEALRLAANGQPHPDPRISATLVGAARHRPGATLSRLVTLTLGMAFFLTLFFLGGEIDDVSIREAAIALTPLATLGAWHATTAQIRKLLARRRPSPPPTSAITPNLRALLQQPHPTSPPQPLSIRHEPERILAVIAALGVATCLAYLTAKAIGRPFDVQSGLIRLAFTSAIGLGVAYLNRRKDPAARRSTMAPAHLTADGVRIGVHPRIPWHAIHGIHLADTGVAWDIRGKRRLIQRLDLTRVTPEQVILTARAYAAASATATATG
ncbi:MAG: hypothetical protein HOV79_06725 [Hamadaea sp.]|nr:hypothetical protein [Hamadaea sp.]